MPSEPPASNSHVPGGVINPSSGAGDAMIAKAPQGGDAEFVDKAAIAGKAEVQASQLALRQAQSPDVRAFAQRMVADHGKANARLNEIAARQGMKPQVEQIQDPDVEALRGSTVATSTSRTSRRSARLHTARPSRCSKAKRETGGIRN